MSGNLSRILTGLAFTLMPVGNALADVKITISFMEHQHVLTPPPEHDWNVKRTVTLFVSRDGKARTEYSSPGRFFQAGIDHPLGSVHAGRNPSGLNQVGRIRIDNGHIVMATFLPTFKIVTDVTTHGKSTCLAQRTYELLPVTGFLKTGMR
jgi:hypothetical protein